jgi:hypothetical protein
MMDDYNSWEHKPVLVEEDIAKSKYKEMQQEFIHGGKRLLREISTLLISVLILGLIVFILIKTQ